MTQNEPHFGRNTDTFWAADWGPRPYSRYFEVVLACHKLSVPGSTICKPQVSLQRVSECWNQLFSQIDPKLCGRPTALVRGAFVKDFFPPVLGHSPEALGEALQKPWSCLLAQAAAMSDAGSGSLLDALLTDVTGLHTPSALGLRRLLCVRPRLFNGIFNGSFFFVPRRPLCTSLACPCDQSLNQG